jgi:hypothetical protein
MNKFDDKQAPMDKYVRENLVDANGMHPADLVTKGSNDFHQDYRLMLGQEFIDAVKANPYEQINSATDSSRSASPASFRKKKGYCQHMNEFHRNTSKKSLHYHLRNGSKYIEKEDIDNEWYEPEKQ